MKLVGNALPLCFLSLNHLGGKGKVFLTAFGSDKIEDKENERHEQGKNDYKNQDSVGIINLVELKAHEIFLKDFPASHIVGNLFPVAGFYSLKNVFVDDLCLWKIVDDGVGGSCLFNFDREFFKKLF